MKSYLLMAVALLGAMQGRSDTLGVVYDDAAVSREFIRATGYFCGNGNPIKSTLSWILESCCSNDTNRYVRIVKETATTNASVMAMAIRIVKLHGGDQDLPFLYACTNNPVCAARALTGILQLGGLTEESVAAASAYIAGTNRYHILDRNNVAEELFRAAAAPSASSRLRAIASSNALHFASNSSGGDLEYNDIGFKNADPSYEYSKRRLGVLRAVLPDCQGYDNLMNYATNAINELVAYPEADLPE